MFLEESDGKVRGRSRQCSPALLPVLASPVFWRPGAGGTGGEEVVMLATVKARPSTKTSPLLNRSEYGPDKLHRFNLAAAAAVGGGGVGN